MFHVTDWLPTLIGGMLGRPLLLPADLDGIDQWDWLLSAVEQGTDSGIVLKSSTKSSDLLDSGSDEPPSAPRTEFVYNVDTVTGISAMRRDNFKLILNESLEVGWHSPYHWGSEVCTPVDMHTNSVQLYDLEKDPEERVECSAVYPAVVKSMQSALLTYME